MANNTPITSMRLDPELKEEAKEIFDELGITFTAAINMYLAEVVRTGGLPLQMHVRENKTEEDK